MKNKHTNTVPLIITPDSKIGEILYTYPELEDVLIKLVPSFGKLKNPILRKTIGRIATIRQASELGKISLGMLINHLREVVGQDSWSESTRKQESFSSTEPEWVKTATVIKSIDARPILDRGEHPVQLVMTELSKLSESELLEFITAFIPSPLIDMARSKGFKSLTREEAPEIFQTFFGRSSVSDK